MRDDARRRERGVLLLVRVSLFVLLLLASCCSGSDVTAAEAATTPTEGAEATTQQQHVGSNEVVEDAEASIVVQCDVSGQQQDNAFIDTVAIATSTESPSASSLASSTTSQTPTETLRRRLIEVLKATVNNNVEEASSEKSLDKVLDAISTARWNESSFIRTAALEAYPRTFRFRRFFIISNQNDEEMVLKGVDSKEGEDSDEIEGLRFNPSRYCHERITEEASSDENHPTQPRFRRVPCQKETKKTIEKVLDERGLQRTIRPNAIINSVDLFWVKVTLPSIRTYDPAMNMFKRLLPHQRINRLPHATEINRKDLLAEHLKELARRYPNDDFKFHPETFELPRDEELVLKELDSSEHNLHWIAKPMFGGQGMGIHLNADARQLISVAKEQEHGGYVLQKYIRNPLLVNGFKFTMRLYVAISLIDPIRIWLYDDGIAKFTTTPYSNATEFFNNDNMLMHITNQALNKEQTQFVYSEDPNVDNIGSRWSIKAMRRHLREKGVDDELLWSRVKDALVKTIAGIAEKAVETTRNELHSVHGCFQLFGVDVDVDSELNPWLIEANVNPTIGGSKAAFDNVQKERLLRDFFDIVGIVKFDRSQYVNDIEQRLEKTRPDLKEFFDDSVVAEFIHEVLHSGGFELIYPEPTTMSRYTHMFPATISNAKVNSFLSQLNNNED